MFVCVCTSAYIVMYVCLFAFIQKHACMRVHIHVDAEDMLNTEYGPM